MFGFKFVHSSWAGFDTILIAFTAVISVKPRCSEGVNLMTRNNGGSLYPGAVDTFYCQYSFGQAEQCRSFYQGLRCKGFGKVQLS